MDEPTLRRLLDNVRSGAVHADEAVAKLQRLPFVDIGFARVDHHRALRQRLGEAVYAPGKTAQQCSAVVAELLTEAGDLPVLLTRANPEQVAITLERNPGGKVTLTGLTSGASVSGSLSKSHTDPLDLGADAHGVANDQLATVSWRPSTARRHKVVLVTAGTADLPIAAECRAALDAFGLPPVMLVDCGVAGLHRLLASVDELTSAEAVVVVAGMEGALASVVGGITSAPVVAVPTSTGYGAAFQGVTALLAMLSSCAAGLTVVGIDNGFGAACAVARMFANERTEGE